MKRLLHFSFVIAWLIYANTASAQPIWTNGCYIHENDIPYEPNYQYKPIRKNTADGQYYGLGNTFKDATNNNISLNVAAGCGLINQGVGNLGTQGLDYDMWTNGDVDDLCIFGLYDQNVMAGHPFPYLNIQYMGNFDIAPPAGINYISGSVHAHAFGMNHGPPTLPNLGWLLHNTGEGKAAAVYSYLKNPSGVKKFRLKGFRTNDWVYVPYQWELYDIALSIPSASQILDVVGVESYLYVFYYSDASALKVLVFDYDGNQINNAPFTHSLPPGDFFNMASIQFYIDVSTVNVIGDCYKSGKNRIFADKLTTTGFAYTSILPLSGNPQGLVYNLKSELQDNSIYIDAKNLTTNKRVLYKINRTTFALSYAQTMNYTGEYFIDKSTGGTTDFYIFNVDVSGTSLKVDRYDETPSGFTTLTATSAVNCFLPPFGIIDFFPLEFPPYKLLKVIDQGYACLVILDEVTHTPASIGPFELIVDLTGFPLRSQNAVTGHENSDAAISTFPNPTADVVTVSFTSVKETKGTLRLCDLTGKVLLEEQLQLVAGTNHQTISTGSFEPGIYFISIATEEGVITSKLIRQ